MQAKKRKLFLSAVMTALLLLVFGLDLFSFAEHKAQDAAYQQPGLTDPNIVVIGIDEKALSAFGPFQQWSRQRMADAIQILNSDEESKPAVIAIDVMYTEEGADREADAALVAAAQSGGNVVLASYALMGYNLSGERAVTVYQKPFAALEPYVSYGLVNGTVDTDNVIRQALLKIPYEDETLYSFPSTIYQQYTGAYDEFTESHDDAYITYTGLPGEYYGTEELGVSFADIFEEDFDPAFFADAIVLIGPYATGLMDAYYTPISAKTQMYGVEIHANVLQMMLEGQYKLYVPFWINFAIFLGILLLALILAEFTDIRLLLALLAALGVGYYFLAVAMFGRGYILTLIYPPAALVIVYVYQLVYGYIQSAREKARLRGTFKKYVDPKLVDKLIESGEADSDAVGVKRPIAVLFVDVRGFTPMTERLRDTPELIVHTLNEYLELTATAVFKNGGSVDKFIGDATMALFNGFVPLEDYVYRAVKSAWDIVQGAKAVNASIKEKYNIDLGFGVGVHCGEAIVGNLGPSFRKDYTAIGDTVNTAARLESNAKREQVLISKDVYEAVKDRIEAESIGEIPLKGKSIKLEVFSVTNVK